MSKFKKYDIVQLEECTKPSCKMISKCRGIVMITSIQHDKVTFAHSETSHVPANDSTPMIFSVEKLRNYSRLELDKIIGTPLSPQNGFCTCMLTDIEHLSPKPNIQPNIVNIMEVD